MQTTASSIGITWSDGLSNGQAAIEDYRVYYKAAASITWILLSSTVPANTKYYLVNAPTITLTQGTTYEFKV